MSTYAQQQAAAKLLGGELGMTAWLSAKRRQAEEEQAAAREAFEASDEGELAALASTIRVEGAMLTPEQWASAYEGQPVPPQPREAFDLNLAERQILHDRRMAALLQERTNPR